MREPLAESDVGQRGACAREALGAPRAGRDQRHLDVLFGGQPGIRWCSWKTKPSTSRRKRAGSSQLADRFAVDERSGRVGTVEAGDRFSSVLLPAPDGPLSRTSSPAPTAG